MEKIIEKIFDLKSVPVRFIFAVWICCVIILSAPNAFLSRIHINEFIETYDKFIGIVFIITSSLLVVSILDFCIRKIYRFFNFKSMEKEIRCNIKNLDHSEKAILREFILQGKNTLQLPVDDPTVVGLEGKGIIYRVSEIGYVYGGSPKYSCSITIYASKQLKNWMLDMPNEITNEVLEQFRSKRPYWINNQ